MPNFAVVRRNWLQGGGGGGCGGLVWDGRRVFLKYSREVGWGGGQGELGEVEN